MMKVVKAVLREGCIMMMPGLKKRWWELELACGHVAERGVRYRAPGDGYARPRGWALMHHAPSRDLVQPAPKRVRCELPIHRQSA
jgi:hypothetical protein